MGVKNMKKIVTSLNVVIRKSPIDPLIDSEYVRAANKVL